MSDDENPPRNPFEDALRSIADEISRSVERVQQTDWEELARTNGFDPESAKQWLDIAGGWLRGQADAARPAPRAPEPPVPSRPRTGDADPFTDARPGPLDLPTAEQGAALAALDSGRWTIEPGTSALTSRGDGPGPSDALGLVRELRVRDWLSADGEVTLAGRAALARWLDAAG